MCDKTDGSFESGPACKSTFNDVFFSFCYYPLCLLSSGCLLSAELQCAPVRDNLWQAICCVPREWSVSGEIYFSYLLHISFYSLSICFLCRVKSEGYNFLLRDSDWLHCHKAWDEAVYPGILGLYECFFFFSRYPPEKATLVGLWWAVTSFVWYNKGNECTAIRCLFCLIVAWLCHCHSCS